MTVRLSPGSPRAVHASRFGAELDRAMRTRGTGAIRLAEAVGCGSSGIANYRGGHNLPRLDTALRLAEALQWPRLAEIAREGRTGHCRRCGRPYVNQGGTPKAYCSATCREVDAQLRAPQAGQGLAQSLRDIVADRDGKTGGIPEAAVTGALDAYAKSESHRVRKTDQQAAEALALRDAIAAMCRSCEPEGLCRDTACALRSFSPLPVAGARPSEIRPRMTETASGRAAIAAAQSEASTALWAREGHRERMSAANAARWASKSDQERQEIGMRISAGRRAAAS